MRAYVCIHFPECNYVDGYTCKMRLAADLFNFIDSEMERRAFNKDLKTDYKNDACQIFS